MLGNLLAVSNHGGLGHPQNRAEMLSAITSLLDAGSTAGDIRPDIIAENVAAHLVGIFTIAGSPAQHAQAIRLLDQVMGGIRAPRT